MPKRKALEPLVNSPVTTPAPQPANLEAPAVEAEATNVPAAPPKKLEGVIQPRRIVMPNGCIREDF